MNKYKPIGLAKVFLAHILEISIIATIALVTRMYIIPDIDHMYKKIFNFTLVLLSQIYYFSMLLTKWQATLGMQVFSIKLVNEHGNRVTSLKELLSLKKNAVKFVRVQ